MDVLGKKFQHVATLEEFLEKLNIFPVINAEHQASLDEMLALVVAHDRDLVDLEELAAQSLLTVSNLRTPFSEWLDSLLRNISHTVIGRPSRGAPPPLSWRLLTAPVWQTLDAQLGRPLIQFLIFDAAIYYPSSAGMIQVTGKDNQPKRTQAWKNPRIERAFVSKADDTVEFPVHTLYKNGLNQHNQQTVMSKQLHRMFTMHRRPTHMIPAHQIANYCFSCLRALLPQCAFGQQWKLLHRKLHFFIKMPLRSKYYVANMVRGFEVAKLMGRSVNKADSARKQNEFKKFVQWVFFVVVHILLRPFTLRSSGAGDCWFSHTRWNRIVAAQNAKFSESLETWPPQQPPTNPLVRNNSFKSYTVPKLKPGEFRHLINLKALRDTLKDVNNVLQLYVEKALETSHLAAPRDLFSCVHEYLERNPAKQYYVVRTDITACYDNASNCKLWEILDRTLTHPEYEVRQYTRYYGNNQKLLTVANYNNSMPDLGPLPAVYQELQGAGKYLRSDYIRNALSLVLNELVVEVGENTYIKNYGIPQGSSVSVALCDLLCQDMIRTELEPFWACGRSLFLRYVDDFLFVTTDEIKAKRYTAALAHGHSQYGLQYSMHKTTQNFGPNAVKDMVFIGIPLGVDGGLTCLPRLNLEGILNAVRATSARRDLGLKPNLCVNLGPIPYDARQQVIYGRKHTPEVACVNLEKLLDMKFNKLCMVLRGFLRRKMTREYAHTVVRAAIKELCRLLITVGVGFKQSRRLVIKYCKQLNRRSHLRYKLIQEGTRTWLNLYKAWDRQQRDNLASEPSSSTAASP